MTEDGELRVYTATFSHASDWFLCHIPGCTGLLTMKWNLCGHFLDRHPDDLVNIPGKGVYHWCGLCHMQVSPSASRHDRTQQDANNMEVEQPENHILSDPEFDNEGSLRYRKRRRK